MNNQSVKQSTFCNKFSSSEHLTTYAIVNHRRAFPLATSWLASRVSHQ